MQISLMGGLTLEAEVVRHRHIQHLRGIKSKLHPCQQPKCACVSMHDCMFSFEIKLYDERLTDIPAVAVDVIGSAAALQVGLPSIAFHAIHHNRQSITGAKVAIQVRICCLPWQSKLLADDFRVNFTLPRIPTTVTNSAPALPRHIDLKSSRV